jgi:hypothetical protein
LQAWEEMCRKTLDRKKINEVNWLLYASDALYKKWRSVCREWMAGRLPGPNGENPAKVKPVEKITSYTFKAFEGKGLTEDAISDMLDMVASGKCLLTKNKKCPLQSLAEVADSYKDKVALQPRIVLHLVDTFPTHFGTSADWTFVVTQFPELGTDLGMKRLITLCPESFMDSLRNKNKSKQQFPAVLAQQLESMVAKAFGTSARERKEPFQIVLTDDLLQSSEPSLIGDKPFCRLAIIDFARRLQAVWSAAQLQNFFTTAFNLSRSETMVFVVFIRPTSKLFLEVLSSMKNLEAHFTTCLQFGSFSTNDKRWLDGARVFVANEKDTILYFGISSQAKENWSEIFGSVKTLDFHIPTMEDFQTVPYRTSTESIVRPESDDARKLRERTELRMTLQCRAPNYHFFNKSEFGFLNEDGKPKCVYSDIISWFSTENQTVFDFFSGGQGLRSALWIQRECYCFVEMPKQKAFLEDYPSRLKRFEKIRKLFDVTEAMHKNTSESRQENSQLVISESNVAESLKLDLRDIFKKKSIPSSSFIGLTKDTDEKDEDLQIVEQAGDSIQQVAFSTGGDEDESDDDIAQSGDADAAIDKEDADDNESEDSAEAVNNGSKDEVVPNEEEGELLDIHQGDEGVDLHFKEVNTHDHGEASPQGEHGSPLSDKSASG